MFKPNRYLCQNCDIVFYQKLSRLSRSSTMLQAYINLKEVMKTKQLFLV